MLQIITKMKYHMHCRIFFLRLSLAGLLVFRETLKPVGTISLTFIRPFIHLCQIVYPINEKQTYKPSHHCLYYLPVKNPSLNKNKGMLSKKNIVMCDPNKKIKKCVCKTRGAITPSLSPHIKINYVRDIMSHMYVEY